jgi:hypothetical protein
MSPYAEWIAQVSDRGLIALWEQYCAPTEDATPLTKQQLERACLISYEIADRNLSPIPMNDNQ